MRVSKQKKIKKTPKADDSQRPVLTVYGLTQGGTATEAGRRRRKGKIRKSHIEIVNMNAFRGPSLQKIKMKTKKKRKKIESPSVGRRYVPQVDCICPTGQVVLNISQFSQRTVELLRTT